MRCVRRLTSLLLVLSTLLPSLVPATGGVFAQEPAPIASSSVWGVLNTQFESHNLLLRPFDVRQPVRIEMEYVPQGRWPLDDRIGFFLFDRNAELALEAGALPGSVAVAAGDALPGFPRKLQAIILQPREEFRLLVFNDSTVPAAYQLTVENGEIVDPTGRQVRDRWNPAPGVPFVGPGEDRFTIPQVLPPFLVVPAPTPVPTPTPTPLPPTAGMVVRGALEGRYDSDFYVLEVLDTNLPVQIEMVYDPQEQFQTALGFEFNVFSEAQFRILERDEILPWRAQDTTEGHLVDTADGRLLWRAEIVEPFGRYILVVSQFRFPLLWLGYQLRVENAILIDETRTSSVVLPTPVPERLFVHLVEPGESLASIAQRFYGEFRLHPALCSYNRLPNCARIEIGSPILIPPSAEIRTLAGPLPAPTAPAVIWGCSKC